MCRETRNIPIWRCSERSRSTTCGFCECSVLQCVAACCSVLQRLASSHEGIVRGSLLEANCCNTLQHIATHCNRALTNDTIQVANRDAVSTMLSISNIDQHLEHRNVAHCHWPRVPSSYIKVYITCTA